MPEGDPTHVITNKCADEVYAACVDVCPVDCIHPVPYPKDPFKGKPFMVIDPETCINCGNCLPACPINAIVASPEEDPAAAKLNRELTPEAIKWEAEHGRAPNRQPNDPPHRPDNKLG